MKFVPPHKDTRTKRFKTGNSLVLENVKIGDEECRVDIMNFGGQLSIQILQEKHRKNIYNDIYEEEDVGVEDGYDFRITINEKGKIYFSRYHHRKHDHNDIDNLQIEINDKGEPTGQPFWGSRGPYKHENKDYFRIDFGAISDFIDDEEK